VAPTPMRPVDSEARQAVAEDLDILFSEAIVGTHTLRHRMVGLPHAAARVHQGVPSDAHIDWEAGDRNSPRRITQSLADADRVVLEEPPGDAAPRPKALAW
jgi:hypothetical protein